MREWVQTIFRAQSPAQAADWRAPIAPVWLLVRSPPGSRRARSLAQEAHRRSTAGLPLGRCP